MKDISLRTQASWPQGLPGDAEDGNSSPEQAFSDAADLADSLAANAMRIPDSVGDIPMSQADKAGFNAEAFTLHEQAVAECAEESIVARLGIALSNGLSNRAGNS